MNQMITNFQHSLLIAINKELSVIGAFILLLAMVNTSIFCLFYLSIQFYCCNNVPVSFAVITLKVLYIYVNNNRILYLQTSISHIAHTNIEYIENRDISTPVLTALTVSILTV